MQSGSKGTSLQEVLHYAATSVTAARTGEATGAPGTTSASVAWTSMDQSRLSQKVLEELARRREQSQGMSGVPSEPVAAPNAEAGLFEPSAAATPRVEAPRVIATARIRRRVHADVRDLVNTAYRSLFRRLPEDHVMVNPKANAEFIVRCRDLGATVSEVVLNRTLLNNRKHGRHADVVRESVPALASGTSDRIGHAVEIAASLVQREWAAVGHQVPSVDDILCNPDLRSAFGTYVAALQSNVDVVDSHLVLLAFRKAGTQSSTRLADIAMPERCLFAPLRSLDPKDVPDRCGVYRILCRRAPVFVSATVSLRHRILRHIEYGARELLPDAIPFLVDGPLSVEVFAPRWQPRRAEAVARSMRIEDYPDLNWREKGALFDAGTRVIQRAMCCGEQRLAAVG